MNFLGQSVTYTNTFLTAPCTSSQIHHWTVETRVLEIYLDRSKRLGWWMGTTSPWHKLFIETWGQSGQPTPFSQTDKFPKLYGSFSPETRAVSGKSGPWVTMPGKPRGWWTTVQRFQCISTHREAANQPGHLPWTRAIVRTR